MLPPNQNSIGLIAYNTALTMAAEAEVRLYAKRPSYVAAGLQLPFETHFVDAPWDDGLHNLLRRYPRWARRLGVDRLDDRHFDYTRRIATDLERSRTDIVHVMNYWSWARRLRGPKSGRKLVLEMHCEWLSEQNRDAIAYQLEAVDAVIGVSDHIIKLFKRAFPDFPGTVATVYNGVDVDVFTPAAAEAKTPDSAARPVILFVGRVSPEKGVHTLMEALPRVLERFPEARLEIVGAQSALPANVLLGLSSDPLVAALARFYDGSVTSDYRTFLRTRVEQLGLGQRVQFLGAVPHRELVDCYRRADLVVNPSLSESFGMSVVEAMACGIPVVASRVGGMQETMLEGQTGLLVEPENPDRLAASMNAILADRDRSSSMSVAGRERAVAQFSWAARARRVTDVYRRLA